MYIAIPDIDGDGELELDGPERVGDGELFVSVKVADPEEDAYRLVYVPLAALLGAVGKIATAPVNNLPEAVPDEA